MSGINNPPASVVSAFAAPGFTLGTSNVEGAASTAVRSDATILTYDATVPVTQAFADVAAAGAAAVAAHRDHRHGMMAAPAAGALTREGGNTTEATTTSTSVVDLITVSGLTIAAAQAFDIQCRFRKTAGAASGAAFGLKLNTTAVAVPRASTPGDNRNVLGGCTATDRAESGIARFGIGPTVTNYSFGSGQGVWAVYTSTSSGQLIVNALAGQANRPTAEITDVIGSAQSESASQTIGMDELQVYGYQVS